MTSDAELRSARTLRGFHNVCRHRAGPLVTDPAGRCANLVCQYHGWSYDCDGALLAAPTGSCTTLR